MKTLSFTLLFVLNSFLSQSQIQKSNLFFGDTLPKSAAQTIEIVAGWSGISGYLDPANPAVAFLMAAIEEHLLIIRDFAGNFYQPASKSGLTHWDFKQGYFDSHFE